MDGEVIKSTSIGSTFYFTCDNFAKECKESNQRKLIISFICTEIRKISITNKTAQTLGYPLVKSANPECTYFDEGHLKANHETMKHGGDFGMHVWLILLSWLIWSSLDEIAF